MFSISHDSDTVSPMKRDKRLISRKMRRIVKRLVACGHYDSLLSRDDHHSRNCLCQGRLYPLLAHEDYQDTCRLNRDNPFLSNSL